MIVEFPCRSGKSAKLAKDMKAVDQLDLVKKIQKEWSDNAVSCTVYYKKEELQEIKEWLRKNYKNNRCLTGFKKSNSYKIFCII